MWTVDLGILLHHAENTLSRTNPDSEAKLWIHKHTEVGSVLDVKVICQHNVYGIEIQIPSTAGDKPDVYARRKRKVITTAESARSWFFGEKLTQDTRINGKT